MKVLVTGAGGLLAHAVVPVLAAAGHEVRSLGHAELDVTNAQAVNVAVGPQRLDWVFHLAAFTRVDDCEKEQERAHQVNAIGARHAALAAARAGAALLAISTDYVFDGSASAPYREESAAAPLNVYGASKWAGEQAIREAAGRHLIVRTAWLFGAGGGNFVDTILKQARTEQELSIVDDQRGSPTYTPDLAEGLARLAGSAENGTYHVVNGGDASWFELAEAAVTEAGLPVRMKRVSTASLGRPARRPAYSVLDASKFTRSTGWPLPHWRDAVARHVRRAKEAA